ncbi:MAG: hypothetical protein A3G33_09525 [Omnitrophica bacterium RIFCSPLOWO2_12_FULL_44_17]|uniref:Uncharacterized protein n=1 Tax=Candidatus Danuiimicrobium aquiferis TaxID=1801832 RepID=A0A1G1KX09_9BACT|nr:MAG: hypothetical protein A3B72_09835 [Omnitrophica bacterium RIFCSPHIGHO2_02_FULL_45_28]OGW89616.1 MAG: hypothetical protein A3E74_04975 [Omnitrophica bacterium RIFCSPHIGHO2_12_FULL_44_12]OGW97421.1 MAG: hypothetical protein A3G33_09525 [Omnitrophica bacterium RIFCSPLOWO2_12_FULL_44_17]OGX04495.1 MAG: hypothetical protein A3J12_10565 [Omnitrophica bacterium RIFCSPLOWO2_02_FULL_44_11]
MKDQDCKSKNWFEQNPKRTTMFLILGFVLSVEAISQGCFFIQHRYFIFNDPFKVRYIQEIHDEREYALKKNYHDARYRINREGYRGAILQGDPDILMLGDSVPFGSGAKEQETYPYILSNRYGLKVINGGVPSYSYRQSLLRWQKDFNGIHPKIVTVQAANDTSLVMEYQNEWKPGRTWLRKAWIPEISIFDYVFSNSAIYHYIKIFFAKNKSKTQAEFDQSKEESLNPELENRFLNETASEIDEIIRYSIATKAYLILIPVNPFYYMEPKDWEKNKKLHHWTKTYFQYFHSRTALYKKLNAILERKASQYPHVFYFDIISEMDKGNRDLMYRDYIHHTAYGNSIFATQLFEFMKQKGLLDILKKT